jgi:hypothetical protein
VVIITDKSPRGMELDMLMLKMAACMCSKRTFSPSALHSDLCLHPARSDFSNLPFLFLSYGYNLEIQTVTSSKLTLTYSRFFLLCSHLNVSVHRVSHLS